MDRQEIKQTVNDLLIDTLGISSNEITDDATIAEDFGADSLDGVEITMTLEDEFGITISNEEAGKCVTVKDIYDLVERKTIS